MATRSLLVGQTKVQVKLLCLPAAVVSGRSFYAVRGFANRT